MDLKTESIWLEEGLLKNEISEKRSYIDARS